MLTVEKTHVYDCFKDAARGARNAFSSWHLGDSDVVDGDGLGPADLALLKRLILAGTDHGKIARGITLSCDITAPLYWWKQMDQYKVGTVTSSTSTMHTVHKNRFTRDDFSHENLYESGLRWLDRTIDELNLARSVYLDTENKQDWDQIIQMLPSSYNQKRTWWGNYQVLRDIYFSRRNHKLAEWHTFCNWIETLPYAKDLIIAEKEK